MNTSDELATQRADHLLEELAGAYRQLPRRSYLAMSFREALARVGLPGGYVHRDTIARPLTESMKGNSPC